MTKSLKTIIFNYYKAYYKDSLGIPNWERLTNKQLHEERDEALRVSRLENMLGSFKNKKILDIGCGTGGFVVASCIRGAKSYGIEPDSNALEICELKKKEFNLTGCNFYKSLAEKLPFKDKEFDIVHSLTVIEHVQNVEKSISEMIRVTIIGGLIYLKCPNYLSFYEGHYKIFWIPLFPKFLAKIYLKIRKRPTAFIDSINYLTPNFLIKILDNQKIKYKLSNYPIKRQKGLLNFFVYIYQKIFNIEQNVEILIEV